MRSFTLNGRMGDGANVPEPISSFPLGDGSTLVNLPPVQGVGSLEDNWGKVKGYMEVGAKAQENDPSALGGFPFRDVLAAASAGAAIGSAVPAIGTVVGAIVGAAVAVVQWAIVAFGPGPSRWDDAGPDVHWWYTNYAPQAFLDWVESTGNMDAMVNVQGAARALLVYQLTQRNLVLWPDHFTVNSLHEDNSYVYHAAGGVGASDAGSAYRYVDEFYANLGIDWTATKALYATEGPGHSLMYKRSLIYDQNGDIDADSAAGDGEGSGAGLAIAAGAALALKLAM